MSIFASLTNRIFLGSALLAVLTIGAAIYNVNVSVTAQAEQELLRGLEEAGTLIEENRRVQVEHFSREARLIADLPRFKASVADGDSPTALGVAKRISAGAGGRPVSRHRSRRPFSRPAGQPGRCGRRIRGSAGGLARRAPDAKRTGSGRTPAACSRWSPSQSGSTRSNPRSSAR